MKTLKTRSRFFLHALGLFIAFALIFATTEAWAQGFSVTITVNENGQGTLTNTNGFNQALTSSMLADPGPGGGTSVLNYSLFNPPGLVGGDLFLTELLGGPISDVFRFDPNVNGGSAFFYSLTGGGNLADVGLPSAFNTNFTSILENQTSYTLYTPTAGQPGFVTGAGGPVTYRILSTNSVPDGGSTLILLGLATMILLVARRGKALPFSGV